MKRHGPSNVPAPPAKHGQKNTPSEANGQTLPPGPAARQRGKRRPKNQAHVAYALGDVYRGVAAGEIEPKTANAMTYALSTLNAVMAGDVTAEIAELGSR